MRILDRCEALGYPLFVKPANLGSSVGVRRARSREELGAAVDHAFEFDTKVIVEKGLDHPREVECAVLGNDTPMASTPGEIAVDHPDGFYSYAAKYIDEKGATPRIPADLTAAQASAVQRLAVETFQVLECAGLARVDFFLTPGGELYVNEINTLPGFTSILDVPQALGRERRARARAGESAHRPRALARGAEGEAQDQRGVSA